VHEAIVRQAPLAADVRFAETFAVGQRAHAGDPSAVEHGQSLLEFLVVVAVRDVNGADAAIKAAGRSKSRIDFEKMVSNPDY
jgi:hypothetical protein